MASRDDRLEQPDRASRFGWFLHEPRVDYLLAGAALVALWRLGPELSWIAQPPRGELLATFVSATSSNLWAAFAGLLAGLIFFYTLARGPFVALAEERFGDDLYSAWVAALGWTFLLTVATTFVVRPVDAFGWGMAFGLAMVGLRAARVLVLVLLFVRLMRRDWRHHRERQSAAAAANQRPELHSAFFGD